MRIGIVQVDFDRMALGRGGWLPEAYGFANFL